MTDLLREELSRLADHAPPAHLPTDLWSRGRRARRRDRVALGAAVAAVLVAVGASASLLTTPPPSRISPAAPVEGPAAVPTELFDVPEHVLADPASFTQDLAVGRQAAAMVTTGGDAVVVPAADHQPYRLLDLPGWSWDSLESSMRFFGQSATNTLALSPDGRRLAWGYADPTGSGVRTADLESGEVSDYPLRGPDFPGPQFAVTTVVWSPDSTRFAWSAQTTSRPYATWYGYLEDGDFTRELGSRPEAEPMGIGIADSGRVVLPTPGFVYLDSVPGDGFTPGRTLDPTAVAATSPDGTRALVGSRSPNGAVDVLDLDRERLRNVYLSAYDQDVSTSPLGWVDDTTMVVLVESEGGPPEVALIPSGSQDPESYRAVTRVNADVESLSVAVDLLDGPTVERPEPDWPWSDARKLWLLALSVAALFVAAPLAARRWWRIRA